MFNDPGTQYARRVVNGDIIAGKKVIKACKRHLNDLEKENFDYVYLPERAEIAVKFMEILPDISTGKPVKLAQFQKFIVYSLFGWYRKDNNDLRRFNKALISMARKNGKSALISGIAIFEFLAGKHPIQNRQIYCTAQSREQASIVFNMVVQRLDGLLAQSEQIRNSVRKVRNEINHNPSYSVLKPLSKETGGINGFAPTLSILDEYGASKDNSMMEVLESGVILQPNALTLIISTAYFDLNSPMYTEEYIHGEKILNEKIVDDNYFVLVYEQDDEDEIYDQGLWIKSNPLIEVESIKETLIRNLKRKLNEAVEKNSLLGTIVKNFNMWKQGAENSFLPDKEWRACETDPINIYGRDAFLGLDLSRIGDLTALYFIYPLENQKFYVDGHSFVATVEGLEAKSKRDKIDYQMLISKGYATQTNLQSGFINVDQVIEYAAHMIINYNLNVQAFCYDSWHIANFLSEWEKRYSDLDIPFIEVPQNYKYLSEPIKQFRLGVYERKILHSNNPLLNIAVNNAIMKYDNNANIMLDKQKNREKIDPIVATITAFAEAKDYEYQGMDIKQIEAYILSDDFGF
ncbi:phage terminase large subunit [Lentibacillus populi]|uniref:Phage terminase large subunit n=1 Tax=Lentibacillus populi TaxID=1827502 RepID=A0A9W5X7I6_9BACI|nr:terminase TerL endonuclease subunit [Lentibacillus populi]GGB56770.1 phage terminase large subunit [Lentibacillus populi]